MKRRKFIYYGAISSTVFGVNTALNKFHKTNALSLERIAQKPLYDWIILYWMPYDNNLSYLGLPIIRMLTKGVQSDNILVVVESDFSGAEKLSRNIITKSNVITEKLETGNSASEQVFAEYLNWAKANFQAQKWAIIFLGHGGRLDEVSPDENPVPGSELPNQWMNIQKLSDIIVNFNQEVDDRVELLFFQNCAKGTLEAHYTVRHTAKYTLSSQLLLGAPNYYYEQLLKFLGNHPEANGGELAEKIMEYERSDMYHSYTVTNNREVQNLPTKINPLIESILLTPKPTINIQDLNPYYYEGERFVDVCIFFNKIIDNRFNAQKNYNELMVFIKKSMIFSVRKSDTSIFRKGRYQDFSGLGMFLPKERQELDKYRYLQFFSDVKLIPLFDKVLFN
jgi:hypothetical protein